MAVDSPQAAVLLAQQALHLLANPVFVCRIRQRNQVHPGQHGPIVDAALCDGVRQRRDKRASSD